LINEESAKKFSLSGLSLRLSRPPVVSIDQGEAMIDRRDFIKKSAIGAGALFTGAQMSCSCNCGKVPSYLAGYEDMYATDPRMAAVKYFQEAKFGLFMHYGLYSLLQGEWGGVMSRPS
jgi:hypothetical protein